MSNLVQQRLDAHLREESKAKNKDKDSDGSNSSEDGSENKESGRKNADKNEEDDSSIASKATIRTKLKSHHYNDTDEDGSWNNVTEEDEEHTVRSDVTSKVDKTNSGKIMLPKFTRYQMMILLDQGESNGKSILEEKDVDKNPSQRILEFLASFVEQTKKLDRDSRIMSWKTTGNFTYISEDFPTDVAEVAKFFNGYRKNLKADKRVYIRVAIHTPNSELKLHQNLQEWMRAHGYLINKCIIQAETSTCVGWLCYSSQHTDTNTMKEILTELSDFEWGFKMISITEADSNLAWLERARAVGIYVPTPCKDIAVNIIGEAFEASMDSQINIPDITDKFLFMEPERMYKGNKNREIYYARMVERHRVHNDSLIAEPSYAIMVDLNKRFTLDPSITTSDYVSLSVRDMLLDLKVETPDHPMVGTNLFHSVDFFEDSSNLWINGQKCDGAACCIFTYYDVNAAEASTMVKGMGKMVLREYGEDIASRIFNLTHFKGNSGYRWSKALRRFSTPALRRMKANKTFDHNLPAINVLMKRKKEKQLMEERKKQLKAQKDTEVLAKRKTKKQIVEGDSGDKVDLTLDGNSEDDDQDLLPEEEIQNLVDDTSSPTHLEEDSLVVDRIKAKQMQHLIEVQKDDDLEDLDDNSVSSVKPFDINVDDNNSTTSTLKNQSIESRDSRLSGASAATVNSTDLTISTVKSKFGVSNSIIEKIAKEGMEKGLTADEIELQVQQYQALKFNEAKLAASAAVEKYIKASGHIFSNKTPDETSDGKVGDDTIEETTQKSKGDTETENNEEKEEKGNETHSGEQDDDTTRVDDANEVKANNSNNAPASSSTVVSSTEENQQLVASGSPQQPTPPPAPNNNVTPSSAAAGDALPPAALSYLRRKPPNPPLRVQPKRSSTIPNYSSSAGGGRPGRAS